MLNASAISNTEYTNIHHSKQPSTPTRQIKTNAGQTVKADSTPPSRAYEREEEIEEHTIESMEASSQKIDKGPFNNDAFGDDDMPEEYDNNNYPKTACHICGRMFISDRLEKHVVACSKAHKARKVFDATTARIKGTDLEKYTKSDGKESRKSRADAAAIEEKLKAKKASWRNKHDAFVQMVRAARLPAGASGKHGTSSQQMVQIDPNPDYVTCPTCNRRFNEDAGARHMPICKEKASQHSRQSASRGMGHGGIGNGNGSGSGGASHSVVKEDMLKRRTAYKPPVPKTSKSSPSKR
eukprot:jgi/Hompol1/3792/HPOL_001680-RA